MSARQPLYRYVASSLNLQIEEPAGTYLYRSFSVKFFGQVVAALPANMGTYFESFSNSLELTEIKNFLKVLAANFD